jgi:preprotein translocase subunit SecB
MKPKISPKDYRAILESLELDTLFLVESSTKFKEEYLSETLSLDIIEKYTFEQKSNLLTVFYNYKLSAKAEDQQEPALVLTAKYTVKYSLTKEFNVTRDFMNIFCDLTLGMLLWTYFREFVSNTVYRTGLPPLVLPLKKK